jgi:hypothetical protein
MKARKTDPLGIPSGYHSLKVDVDKIRCDIETKFPRLWQMLQLHPVTNLKILSGAALEKVDESGKDSSGMYNHPSKTIYLNSDAFDIVNAKGPLGFNEWTIDPEVGVPTLSQTSRDDFYTLLAVHEIGHHFQDFAQRDRKLASETQRSYMLHSAMWESMRMMGVPSARVGDQIAAATGTPSMSKIRPVVSMYAAKEVSEYFAEDFATYWYFPEDLKLIDSVAYDVVEKVVAKALATKKEKAA